MFEKLADLVIKRYKLIIVLWIVVLFYIFPLIFKINDVVVYQESESGLEDLEAMVADEIIAENFAGQIPPSTIMIVVQNSDVLSEGARDFTWALYEDMNGNGALEGVQSVNFLYSAIEGYLIEVTYSTAPALHELYAQVNQTSQMVFGVPVQIAGGHLLTMQMMGLTPSAANDSIVQAVVLGQLEAELLLSGLDESLVAMTMGYATVFYDSWLAYGGYPTDPAVLDALIQQAAYAYFATGSESGQFALSVATLLSVQVYDNATDLAGITVLMLSQMSGLDPEFLSEVYALGPSPAYEAVDQMVVDVILTRPFAELPAVPEFLVDQFVNTNPDDGERNTTMLMVLPLTVGGATEAAERDVRSLRLIVSDHLAESPEGFAVYVSGDPALNVDIMDSVEEDTSRIDPVTVVLVIVLVGLFFRSAVSPLVPLMTVGMAFLTSTAFIYLLGSLVMEIHYSVMTIVLVIMLGAGTDYCIFMMSRYREERILGRSKEEAVKTSLMWAGESIATSGATVMIGFGALMIGEFSLVRSMGMALVVAVGMALLFSLTMLPSMLMLVGDKVFWPNTMAREVAREERRVSRGGGYFRKSAEFSLKHARAIVLAALLISVPAAYLAGSLESSYDFTAALPSAESKSGIEAMGAGFGSGNIMPTYIVVQWDAPVIANGTLLPAAALQLESYCALVDGHENVRSVKGPTRPFGVPVNESYLASLPDDELATYMYTISQTLGTDNRTVMLTVVLNDPPFTTYSIETIDDIREIDSDAEDTVFSSQAQVYVGGSTAGMADVSRTVAEDFFTMRIVVIIGIYIVLLLVLGSLLIPLRLILTVVLNVIWTVAMTMIVFQVVNGVPVLWMMPLILFVVAMGLGMDYDIFLTTRIREEVVKGASDEIAIKTAVERTGGIITACGLVMGGAFGSMLLSRTALLQEFGFGLSFAILLDAMVVRIYLVPAIMLLLKKWNWYAPGRLQRVRRENGARKH